MRIECLLRKCSSLCRKVGSGLAAPTSEKIQSPTPYPDSFCPGHRVQFLQAMTVRAQLTIWCCFHFL